MTGGRELDVTSVTNLLFNDQHFLNRKYTTTTTHACMLSQRQNLLLIHNSINLSFYSVLGDLLSKRPPTKKVEQFFSTQVRQKINGMVLDSKIQGKI